MKIPSNNSKGRVISIEYKINLSGFYPKAKGMGIECKDEYYRLPLKPQDLYLRNPPTSVRGQANQILMVLKNPNTPLVRGFLTLVRQTTS
ncbi:MAG: hypothetical protein AABW75_01490 [Nanoarchaeota archaeon]